jgi:tripartite-type tricarboxylate transporter receptor subunit TctC
VTRLFALVAATLVTAVSLPAMARYPDHPVTIVVPTSPGGTSDLMGRLAGQYLTQALGQTFIVENRAGAGNTVGAGVVARSAPDGYTLLLADASNAISQSVYSHLPYDTGTAFTHVASISRTPYVLVANPKLGVTDMKGLIALAKTHPGKLTYASSGVGTASHLAGALFAMRAKIDMVHVPYKGGGPALSGVLSDQTDMLFIAAPSAVPLVAAKQLTAILSTDAAGRAPGLGGIPTAREQGLQDYSVIEWFGLSAAKGTPADVVQILNREINKMLAQPEVKKKLSAQGMEPAPMTAQAYSDFFNRDIKRWSGVVKAANAHVD